MKIVNLIALSSCFAVPLVRAKGLRSLQEEEELEDITVNGMLDEGAEMNDLMLFNTCGLELDGELDDIPCDDLVESDMLMYSEEDEDEEDDYEDYDEEDEDDNENRARKLQYCPIYPYIPIPKISYRSSEPISGSTLQRVNFGVNNYRQFPTWLFHAAPHLPPCGLNTNSARSWVHIYKWTRGASEQRVYGFCALTGGMLDTLWVALDPRQYHYIRIKVHDRQYANCHYSLATSNWIFVPRRL